MNSPKSSFGNLATDLPRRDLVAIFQYLNCKKSDGRSKRQQTDLAGYNLGGLTAASRLK